MIERKILYYPTILVPSQWIKWAVLYWDKACSIMPRGLEHKLPLANPVYKKDYETMTVLLKEGVFEFIRPEDLWHCASTMGRALELEFKEIASSKRFQACINENWQKDSMFRIHRDKISDGTLDFLRNSKLIAEDKNDPSWYFAEQNVSLLYMSLLAKQLADMDVDYTVPSTDWEEYETILFRANLEKGRYPAFNAEFKGILPIPRDDVPVKDILNFRTKKRDELLHFREFLDGFQREIAQANNENEIKGILVKCKERIEQERSNLDKAMKNVHVKTTFAAFRSLFSIKSPALIETIEGMGLEAMKTPTALTAIIVVGTASVHIGCEWISIRSKQRAQLSKSPFSYLYYAKRKQLV